MTQRRGKTTPVRLTLLGVGAMNSPRYAPAGLLIQRGRARVMIDGGPGAAPSGPLSAWLVTDDRGELGSKIRKLARDQGLEARVGSYQTRGLRIEPHAVKHTSHPSFGYAIRAAGKTVVWAPEFLDFPTWAKGADLMFAEAAGWNRPIRFRGGVGGHAAALDVAYQAAERGVRRLIFAHIGRPTIRAMDSGERPAFGEFGDDGAVYVLDARAKRRSRRTTRT